MMMELEKQRELLKKKKSEEAPKKCPRCDSMQTKFCYFNNYSASQPRHFCKSCKRYWTDGGTLRNVPHGGATSQRRPKRARISPSTSIASPSSSSSSLSHTVFPQTFTALDPTMLPSFHFPPAEFDIQVGEPWPEFLNAEEEFDKWAEEDIPVHESHPSSPTII